MSFKRKKNRTDGGIAKKDQVMKGKPASCHPEKSIYCRGLCKNCYNKWLLKNNPKYAEKQQKNCRDWIEKNKERKKQSDKDYVKKRVKDDPQYHSIKNLRQYGMTLDDYDRMLDEQGGGCAICGKEPKDRRLHVDHCHETGIVRGLLCFRCNFGLSYFGENAERMKRAYEHLLKSELK